jgi:CcmD family protein
MMATLRVHAVRGTVALIAAAATQAVLVAQAAQQQEFVPLTDATRENLPATPLLYIAYGFVWVALVAYVFLLWQRVARVERELAGVTAKLADRR